MKKTITFTFALLLTLASYSQQIGIGLRDNQYVNAEFIGKQHYVIGFEQSLLNVRIPEQSGKLYAGYEREIKNVSFRGILYGGSEYTGHWQSAGSQLSVGYHHKRFGATATLNPHYDTDLKFLFCYNAEAYRRVCLSDKTVSMPQSLDIVASYGNIPEYRDAVNNLRFGIKYTCGNFWFKPVLCIPGINENNKYLRVLCSVGWRISLSIK